MRKALIIPTFGVVFLASSGAAPPPTMISPSHCPTGTGASHDPFYDVTAILGGAQPRRGGHPLVVRGQYRLNQDSGTLVLHEVHYGVQSHLLEVELRRNNGPRNRTNCVNFHGSFNRADAHSVRIVDSKGRRITVDVHRPTGPQPRL